GGGRVVGPARIALPKRGTSEGANMPQYLSPGVYVEEVQSGARPIEGVGTAVAAFVGFAEQGPFHRPTLVASWNQYVQNFGGFLEGAYLPLSVYGYFANGRRAGIGYEQAARTGTGRPGRAADRGAARGGRGRARGGRRRRR